MLPAKFAEQNLGRRGPGTVIDRTITARPNMGSPALESMAADLRPQLPGLIDELRKSLSAVSLLLHPTIVTKVQLPNLYLRNLRSPGVWDRLPSAPSVPAGFCVPRRAKFFDIGAASAVSLSASGATLLCS